ncbi:alpha/beta fold hydrolase [Arthrobacter tecti]
MIELHRTATARTLRYRGTIQRYWDFEPDGSAPVRPPLFMVHGFRGDHHGLLRIVEALPGHRVITPDLPGFGQSEPLPGTHDVTAYAEFVLSSVGALGLGPDTVLVGHSFGSIIAAHAAADASGTFSALVLINPISAPALEGSSRIATRLAELYYRLGSVLPESAGQQLLRNRAIVRAMSELMAKTRNRDLRRWIHGQHRAYFSAFASRDVVLQAFTASISGTVRDSAPHLLLPVLLIAAEKDDLGSIATQQALAGLIPDSKLAVIEDVGHLIHYETPDIAARTITEFLEDIAT